jgi:hypothetical protein
MPNLNRIGNGAYVVTGNQPAARRCADFVRRSYVVPIAISRHTPSAGRHVVFGSINMRSLSPTKRDDLLAVIRDRSLDVVLLCETWHDADSVSIRRLRSDGFDVVERARPRPRQAEATLRVNHGGVAIGAAAGLQLTAIDVGLRPSTFEYVAARVASGGPHTSRSLCIDLARLQSLLPSSRSLTTICWIVCRRSRPPRPRWRRQYTARAVD